MREQSQEQQCQALKEQLEVQSRLLLEDLLDTVYLLEQKVVLKEKELLEAEESRLSFRHEFTKVLEERTFYENELNQLSDRLRYTDAELAALRTQSAKQEEVYGELLNIRSIQIGPSTIEYALRNAVEDSKRYSKEMVTYRDKLQQCEADRAEERRLLNQKVQSLEEQYASL